MNKDRRQIDNGGLPSQNREADQNEAVGFEEQLEQEFITASKQAREIHASKRTVASQSWNPGLRLAAALGAVVLVVAIGVIVTGTPVRLPNAGSQVETICLTSNTGIVLNRNSQREIANVRIYRLDNNSQVSKLPIPFLAQAAWAEPVESGFPTLVAVSNAYGFYQLKDADWQDANYYVEFAGQSVKAEYSEIRLPLRGSISQLSIDAPAKSALMDATVDPGQTRSVSSQFEITQSAKAKEPWHGSAVHNYEWPDIFSYGQILVGIISVNGTDCDQLRMEVKLDQQLLDYYSIDSKQIRLLGYDKEFADKSDGSLYHQGWYDMLMPPAALSLIDDEEQQLWEKLPKCSLTISQTDYGALLSWTPGSGQQYALAGPVPQDGEAYVCLINDETGLVGGMDSIAISTEGVSRDELWLYDIRYEGSGETGEEIVGYIPSIPFIDVPELLFATKRMRNRLNEDEYFIGLKHDPFMEMEGDFTLRRYDFTLTDPVDFKPLQVNLEKLTGNYDVISVEQAGANVVRLEVTGDHDPLVELPKWDLDADGDYDSTGMSAQLQLLDRLTYPYQVLIRDNNGTPVILRRTYVNPTPQVLGMCGNSTFGVSDPIVAATSEHPATVASAAQFTRLAQTHITSLSQNSGIASPCWYLELPTGKRGLPLSEMRISLTARSLIGETERMSMAATPLAGKLPDSPSGIFKVDSEAFEIINRTGSLTGGSLDDALLNALLEHKENEASGSIDYLVKYFSVEDRKQITDRFELLFGIEPDVLLADGEAAVVAWIEDYRESEYFSHRTISSNQYGTVHWRVKLHDTALGNNGLLIRFTLHDRNQPLAGAYEFLSGGDAQSQVELSFSDGSAMTYYFDFAALD